MKREKHFWFVMLLWLIEVLLIPVLSEGFDDKAHIALSGRATELSTLDSFLRTNLGFEFPNGRNETVANGKTVTELVRDGAFDEDRPILWRPRHHFHNPRLAWDQAGWRPPPFSVQLGESSVIWSQDENQVVGGKHSWKDARDTYFQALTATSDSERKRLYAETFKSLGHLIHLVQDAAVPSHTRNDTHLNYKGIGNPDSFHGWSESGLALSMIARANPPPFNTSLLNQSSANPNAPVPIARIIDSTDGDIGTLGLTPGISMGISEYSSANFFSDETVNSSDFLSPRSSQVEVHPPESDATGTKLRRYIYFRQGFGEQNYPLALASAMLPYVIDPLATRAENGFDAKVLQGYGTKLFPRAVGYSAGLIDYFFRGQIEWTDPDNLGLPSATCDPVDRICVKVRNISLEDTTGSGQLTAFVLCCSSSDGTMTIDLNLVSSPINVSLTGDFQEVVFTLTSVPPPLQGADSWNGSLFLVYKGPLGQEQGVVMTGGPCGNYNEVSFYPQFNYSFFGCNR